MVWRATNQGINREHRSATNKGLTVVPILLVLLLVLLFAGLGFALHVLWIVAVVLFVIWLVGFALGKGEGAGRRSWYRW